MGKLSLRHIVLIVSLLSFLTTVWTVQAQTPTPPSRDTLIPAIQARAQYAVEMGLQPETPTDLQVLFGHDAAATGMSMNEVVEIYGVSYRAALRDRPVLDQLKSLLPSSIGWLVAAILAIWLVLQDVIKDNLTHFFQWLAKATYQQLAGFRPFWTTSLRRYRKALERAHQELKIPFRPDHPLKMQDVYVPLQVGGRASLETVDAYQAIRKDNWLIVTGAPGAGKTMLLRHLALTYARRGLNDFPKQPVPIFLELNRLNHSQTSLIDHLAQAMERNDFPGATSFIQVFLKHGQILLLLDGLDEVNGQTRVRVVTQIKDLLSKYHKTRVVITCRTQVYREEFADQVNRKLEIVEFNDQQIQRFLSAWEADMAILEGKSIQHFLSSLRERPQIMTLARNPLLLTMIAYLYTDTAFDWPDLRAEFYDHATNLLLDRWKGDRNRYRASHKRLILQSLALFNQSGLAGNDRSSIELPTALAQIRDLLPILMLKDDDAQPILDEITERSNLLITVDSGERYQFTHLTLQEFFAAKALKDDPQKLMSFFRADNDTWREVVRLWCGLGYESTDLIRAVYTDNPILAFGCLGDAHKVDPGYADELINIFKNQIDDALKIDDLAHAFASVAADPRPRGSALFDFLEGNLDYYKHQSAVAVILSITNLPKAAYALARRAGNMAILRPYLNLMGDLAVAPLVAMMKPGHDWVLDALREIGTPMAALGLTSLLWDEDNATSYQAAWRLVTLFHQPNVEATLRSVAVTAEQREAKQIEWVWEPFDEPDGSALPVIAGRCAHLLLNAPKITVPENKPSPSTFDPRLVIPLVIGKNAKIDIDRRFYLLSGLSSHLQDKLSNFSINDNEPTLDDWRNIFRPVHYDFATSWHARSITLLLILICLFNIKIAVTQILQTSQLWNWWNALAGMWIIVMLAGCVKISTKELDHYNAMDWLYRVILGVVAVIGVFSSNKILSYVLIGIVLLSIALTTTLWKIITNGLGWGLGGAIVGAVFGAVVGAVGTSNGWVIIYSAYIGGFASLLISPIIKHFGRSRGLREWDFTNVVIAGFVVGAVVGSFNAANRGTVIYFIYIGGFAFALIGPIVKLFSERNKINVKRVTDVLSPLLTLLLTTLSIYFPTRVLLDTWKWPAPVLFWITWISCFSILLWIGNRQIRRANNPLYGLLDEQG